MTEDNNAWVFDSLICFLHGPVWNAPLQTFIEEKSLIFDPNEKSGEGNIEYKKIHDEYKNLVDFMLGTFMEEMHITPEQFEVACLAGRQGNGPGSALSFTQGLFQQIWAANDIRIFIRMMTQRNVELQLQALDMIERQNLQAKNAGGTNEDVKPTISESHNAADNTFEQPLTDDVTKEELEQIAEAEASEKEIIRSMEKEFGNLAEALPVEDPNDKLSRLNLLFDKESKVNSEDIKTRQEYLRAQRDKILAIKKKARANQLNETVKKNGRPGSAQAAQKLLQGNGKVGDSLNGDATMEASLQLRKTLAKRLRNEVVDNDV